MLLPSQIRQRHREVKNNVLVTGLSFYSSFSIFKELGRHFHKVTVARFILHLNLIEQIVIRTLNISKIKKNDPRSFPVALIIASILLDWIFKHQFHFDIFTLTALNLTELDIYGLAFGCQP